MHTGAGMHTHTWTLTQRWLTEKDLERKEGRNKDRGKEWITPAQSEQYSLYQSAIQPVIQPVSQINRWWSWQQLSCLMNCSHCGWAQYAMMSCRHESGGGGACRAGQIKKLEKRGAERKICSKSLKEWMWKKKYWGRCGVKLKVCTLFSLSHVTLAHSCSIRNIMHI